MLTFQLKMASPYEKSHMEKHTDFETHTEKHTESECKGRESEFWVVF
jgi:hypothetical protein